MAVVGARELLPREFSSSYGGGFTASRTVIVTVDGDTSANEILAFVGITEGSTHPEYGDLACSGISIARNGDDTVTVSYDYDTLDKADTNPVARPAQWSFTAGGANVPSLGYYYGEGNGDIRPLTNAVGEYVWEGITHSIAEIRVSITKNYLTRPDQLLTKTNKINNAPFLFGPRYSWLCSGVTMTRESEKVGTRTQKFWKATAELVYREGGYVYKLPHVGWMFKLGNSYERFAVNKGTEWVDSPTPLPLNEDGTNKYGKDKSYMGAPEAILRRVHQAVDFSIFGQPPT